jgi:hypothetical protein
MRTILPALLCVTALLCAALAQDKQPADPAKAAEAETKALATQAYFVLRENCWPCHGEPGKKAYGETVPLDWILDYDQLIKTKTVVPGSAKESRLIYIIAVEGKMPRRFDEHGRPGIEAELPEPDLQILIDWVKAGAPKWTEPDFTHEWVNAASWPQDARLIATHLGLLALPDGEPMQQLKDGKWQELPFTAKGTVLGSLPVGEVTWLLVATEKGTVLQQLDATGLREVPLPAWKSPKRVALVPGANIGVIGSFDHKSPQDKLEHWTLVDGTWSKTATFDEPDQWLPVSYSRNEAGQLLALATLRTGMAGWAMLQRTGEGSDADWEVLAQISGIGTPGMGSMAPGGEALVLLGGELYGYQADKNKWQPMTVGRSKGQFTWHTSEKAWYQAGSALQKLVPWREAAAKED